MTHIVVITKSIAFDSIEVTDLTQSEEYFIGQMQIIMQFFLDLLQVTGDELAPEKCVWVLICHTVGSTFKKSQVLLVGSRYDISYIATH
jgi:hypothetical protein